mmetsp:Transcript_8341/g.10558  ORF Transcript_8341/g.10558 Transcript_8341/m.10558 type:complete len:452 (+) Transcript_8341:115-1470(+)
MINRQSLLSSNNANSNRSTTPPSTSLDDINQNSNNSTSAPSSSNRRYSSNSNTSVSRPPIRTFQIPIPTIEHEIYQTIQQAILKKQYDIHLNHQQAQKHQSDPSSANTITSATTNSTSQFNAANPSNHVENIRQKEKEFEMHLLKLQSQLFTNQHEKEVQKHEDHKAHYDACKSKLLQLKEEVETYKDVVIKPEDGEKENLKQKIEDVDEHEEDMKIEKMLQRQNELNDKISAMKKEVKSLQEENENEAKQISIMGEKIKLQEKERLELKAAESMSNQEIGTSTKQSTKRKIGDLQIDDNEKGDQIDNDDNSCEEGEVIETQSNDRKRLKLDTAIEQTTVKEANKESTKKKDDDNHKMHAEKEDGELNEEEEEGEVEEGLIEEGEVTEDQHLRKLIENSKEKMTTELKKKEKEIDELNATKSSMIWLLKRVIIAEQKMKTLEKMKAAKKKM